jgi:hypothetical protein
VDRCVGATVQPVRCAPGWLIGLERSSAMTLHVAIAASDTRYVSLSAVGPCLSDELQGWLDLRIGDGLAAIVWRSQRCAAAPVQRGARR